MGNTKSGHNNRPPRPLAEKIQAQKLHKKSLLITEVIKGPFEPSTIQVTEGAPLFHQWDAFFNIFRKAGEQRIRGFKGGDRIKRGFSTYFRMTTGLLKVTAPETTWI